MKNKAKSMARAKKIDIVETGGGISVVGGLGEEVLAAQYSDCSLSLSEPFQTFETHPLTYVYERVSKTTEVNNHIPMSKCLNT